MSQKESEWELKLQEKIKENKFVTPSSHLDVEEIKSFIRETLSNREKEIAEEVEKINNKANTGEYLQAKEHAKEHETALNTGAYEATNEVLQLLKH